MLRNILLLCFMLVSLSGYAGSCGSDAECANVEICNDSGQCVPDGRDWNTLKNELNSSQQSKDVLLLKLLEQNNKALNILEKGSSPKRTCSISCSGNGWTNSCSAGGCNTCIPAQCSENHCEAGCSS